MLRPEDFANHCPDARDPLRAKFIAETYLTDPVCYNQVRGNPGLPGTYRDVPVTVMASAWVCPPLAFTL
jgi:purine-nucleoside phosphorylase